MDVLRHVVHALRAPTRANMLCPLMKIHCSGSYFPLRPHKKNKLNARKTNLSSKVCLFMYLVVFIYSFICMHLFLASVKALTVANGYIKANQYSCLINIAD